MKNRLDISDETSRSFSQIMQETVNHVTEIMRSEIQLAVTEVRQKLTQVAKASTFVGIAAVLALYALGFILLGAIDLMATKMAFWLSAVIVGSGLAAVAAIFYQAGRTRLQQAMREPSTTTKNVKENVTWMKERTK